jgi:hypothetical protein
LIPESSEDRPGTLAQGVAGGTKIRNCVKLARHAVALRNSAIIRSKQNGRYLTIGNGRTYELTKPDYFRRRATNKATDATPSKAKEEGSGTGAKNAATGVRFAPVPPLFRTVPAAPTTTELTAIS